MKVGPSPADMFDWNDEEISSIIWGGAEESSDHIVPYPEGEDENGHRNLQKQESSAIKLDEDKFLGEKLDLHLIRPESSSASSRNAGVSPSGMESWPDVASSYNTRGDHALLVNEVLNDSFPVNKYLSKEIGPQDEELPDFVEYGWENIGSFDDLDRMFSNQEPIFASVTLGNSNKMWSACKYTTDSPPKSFSLDANSPFMSSGIFSEMSEDMGAKSQYGKQDGQSPVLSFEKMDDSVSLALQLKNKVSDAKEGGRGESESLVVEAKGHPTCSATVAEDTLIPDEFADKVCGQQTLPRSQNIFTGKTKGKSLPYVQTPGSLDANSAKLSKNELSLPLARCFPSSYNQQIKVEGPGLETFSYNHISNSYITPTFFNHVNPAEEVPQTSNYESGECQPVLLGYEMTSSDRDSLGNPLSSVGKSPMMVPQENIVKLRRRRRRQMQAMLAIQRQLQQIGDPVSHDLSVLQRPEQLPAGSSDEFDYLSAFPSRVVSSSSEQDESSVLSAAANGYSTVETVLHQLHQVVSKLDSALRISIRDSLFRLAKSAVQRQQTSDLSTSPNEAEEPQTAMEDESDANKREVRVTDVETDTNPTDRAVAHLLFHRPVENSTKNTQMPESSRSAELNLGQQVHGAVNLEKLELGKCSETDLAILARGFGSPGQQNLDCMDTSENGPGYITLEGGGPMEVVSSQ